MPSLCAGQVFRPFHHILHPFWPQDDIFPSAKWSHTTLQLLERFHLAMGLPSLKMMYRRPLNALSTCWQVSSSVPPCPAPLLAPRRCIAFRKMVAHHPRASRSLPSCHGSPSLQNDVSSSAKHPHFAWVAYGFCVALVVVESFETTKLKGLLNVSTP